MNTAPSGTRPRRRDPEQTRADIITVATAAFARNGFTGTRVDDIAEQTRTTKRMIYYYFESKEGLYLAVMETAYRVIRKLERDLDVEELEPVDALRQLAEMTYDHHTSHRDFIRLVAIENIHRAEIIAKSEYIRDLNSTAVDTLSRVLDRGVVAGVFRDDVDALDLHALISSYAVFHVANRYTFQVLFSRDLLGPGRQEKYRLLAGDMAVATMLATTQVARGGTEA